MFFLDQTSCSKLMRELHLIKKNPKNMLYTCVASAFGTSVTTSSPDFYFQNLGFFGNLFEFSGTEIT